VDWYVSKLFGRLRYGLAHPPLTCDILWPIPHALGGLPPATRHAAPTLARSVLHLRRVGCPATTCRAAPRTGRVLCWRRPRAASALGVEWGAAMVTRPPAPRGTSVTGVGGGRHGTGGGGAVRSRPAGAQSRRRLIEGAPCGEECWGEKED